MAPVHALFRHEVPCAEVLRVYRSPREPRLVVVDKRNGGKADALNCGLNVAGGELVCAIDADTLVAHDALQHLVAPFMEDSAIVATGGTVRLVNGAAVRGGQVVKARVPRHPLAGAQAVEYVRAFLVGRLGWNLLGGNLLISGAFGVFRRSSLLTIGGYEHASVGEDLELVVRLRRRAYEAGVPAKVVFSPDPVAWTEAPESLRTLARQRNRWFRGLCDVLLRHRRMILNPRYGTAGMIAMPYFLVVEGLAPVLEATGLLLLGAGLAGGWVDPAAVQITGAAYLFSAAVGTAVLVFDDIAFGSYRGVRSRLRLVWLTIFEQLVFRPMTVAWRLWGLKYFFEGRSEWGAQVRRGFSA
jgi:cellulose synthase/poly-beta-1,6-N-acetylglucosamine synthase-like glycosyltransferase